jgi:hypothetical protein
MKTKIIICLLLTSAVVAIGAKETASEEKLVEVGKSYLISNGSAAMQGEILKDLGRGWYLMRRSQRGAGEIKVNVFEAFFIQEQ